MSLRRGQQELLHLEHWKGQAGGGAAVLEVGEMLSGRAEKLSILLQGQSLTHGPAGLLSAILPGCSPGKDLLWNLTMQ